MKGLADSPGDPGEWARHSQSEMTMWVATLQHAVTHADVDVHATAAHGTLEAGAAGQASQLRAAALSDMARLRSCAGALASASMTARPARPGLTELMAVEFLSNALLHLGEDLFPRQDQDMACVCGRAMAATDTHALVCDAVWHTLVARHNMWWIHGVGFSPGPASPPTRSHM